MRDRKRFRLLATVACVPLSMLLAATGSSRADIVSGKLSFTESVNAGNVAQAASGKRQRGRRRRTAAPKSRNSPTTGAQGTTPQQTTPSAPQGPLSQVSYELPIRKPRAGEEQALGLLERVACDSSGATFIIKAGERPLKLHTNNFNSIKFITYTPDVSGEMTCGQRNPATNVVVTFRPSRDARAKFNGEPVALEFVPKDFELK